MPNLAQRLYWSAFVGWHVIGQGRYPYASPQRIARDRDRNLRRMVAYAYRCVPYYGETFRALGLAPNDIRTFDDLRRLPLISAEDLQRHPEAFRSVEFRLEELLGMASSGSTGRPHTVWHDLGSLYVNATDAERDRRMLQTIIGRGWRYSSMSIADATGQGSAVNAATRANALWPRWLALKRTAALEKESLEQMAERLNRVQPDQLGGYGSTIAALFEHLDTQGQPFHRPRIVRYASDALPESARAMIEQKYGCEVFSVYQAVEALKLGWECEAHQGYHINADHYPTRIVDAEGRDVADGEVGEVVICNLTNRGTVLLNYRMGDLAQRIDAPCPCGRNLPRIGWVEGRSADTLSALDGRRVHFSLISPTITERGDVWQYQMVQQARDRLAIKLRAAPECDREALTRAVIAASKQALGEAMRVETRFVDEIPRTAAGKVRYVINEVEAGA
jgi:phenylacetate-CoA ligase